MVVVSGSSRTNLLEYHGISGSCSTRQPERNGKHPSTPSDVFPWKMHPNIHLQDLGSGRLMVFCLLHLVEPNVQANEQRLHETHQGVW